MSMFALVDCNNFYASCEKLFRPDLKYKPVIVLSNNDGCVVARSPEVKALGIKMGEPFFKLQDVIREHGIVCFSSNYTLYADLSHRVMSTLEDMACEVEIASIDEAFLSVDGFGKSISLTEFGMQLKQTVFKHVGLSVSVGIAPTKTLAKLANYAAKKYPATKGVVYLESPERIQRLLKIVPVSDVWGVGRKISKELNKMGINTASELANSSPKNMRNKFSINIVRTITELNGTSCIALEERPPTKQQIMCSRSFSERITTKQAMKEALCSYVVRASEKLRQENQYAKVLTISLRTSAFSKNDLQYSNSKTGQLLIPSQDSRDFIELSLKLLNSVWQDGYRYAKAGVMLSDFYNRPDIQTDLFINETTQLRNPKLMTVIDKINQTGLGNVYFAGQGVQKKWIMKRENLSPAYTTQWKDIPRVR